MDLRPYHLSANYQALAAHVLNYQPFIVSDDVQTGVAYSWLHVKDVESVPLDSFPLVLQRSTAPPDQWDKFVSANARLRRMYDDWIRVLATRYPGGSLLDVACNNGYFPVQAEMFGMRGCLGIDLGAQYAQSIGFLNAVCGTHAGFLHAPYDPVTHTAPFDQQFDVVVASNILPHLPDPPHFLAFLGRMAKEAVFLWTAILDTPEFLVRYRVPAGHWEQLKPFPNCFNHGALVSRGLVDYAFESMGFRKVEYLPWSPEWLPPSMMENHQPRTLAGDLPPEAHEGFKLINELRLDVQMMAVLATR